MLLLFEEIMGKQFEGYIMHQTTMFSVVRSTCIILFMSSFKGQDYYNCLRSRNINIMYY